MIDFLKKQRGSSILGLALDGSRLEGAVLRRTNGSLQIRQTLAVSLALNSLTGDPELVGREIRNHLDQAGIRERRCVVCVPLSLALVLHTKVPDLPEADVKSFLEIEAERGLPYGLEAFLVSRSHYRSPAGAQYASQVAISRDNLTHLEKALRAAQLRPVCFALGIAALQTAESDSAEGILALAVGENTVDLQVTCGGGVAALRSLDGAIETEGAQKQIDADLLARELRITIGQLPAEFRDQVRTLKIFGRGEITQRFVNEIAPRVETMGLRVQAVKAYPTDEFASRPPPDAVVSAAFSAAARRLTGASLGFDFLPPKVSSWQQLTSRFSSKKLVWAGATAGGLLLLVGGAFAVQQWQLSRLQAKWAALQPKVKELDTMQQEIKLYRPWFDESFRSLSILRKLTEAFPEDSLVSAKTLEIRELSTVSCSGVARDNQAFLKVLDQLRATKGITEVKVDQLRGQRPVQFTFNFHWGEARANEN